MALSGLDIFKLLPKKNCGECGVPTCLAFAMKLAGKAVELEECPYVSDDAKAALGDAQAPPIMAIKVGSGDHEVTIGGELYMYRHEKRFFNQTGIALTVDTGASDDDFAAKLKEIAGMQFERVGEPMPLDFIFLQGSDESLTAKAKQAQEITGMPVILSAPLAILQAAVPTLSGGVIGRPEDDIAGALASAELKDIPLIIHAESVDALLELSGQHQGRKLLLQPPSANIAELVSNNERLRLAALKEGNKAAGLPIFSMFPEGLDSCDEALWAMTAICKFGSIAVLRNCDAAQLYPLLTLRQNIFSDPQRPLQMEQKVYDVGEPTPDSPAVITTNFSLTYFIVSGEIDNTGVPAHLLLVECEGMSVLTAWSAGKFNGEIIAKSVKDSGLADRISHRKIIIPGHVARLSGEIEDALPGWEVLVGPAEASDIPAYFKEVWK